MDLHGPCHQTTNFQETFKRQATTAAECRSLSQNPGRSKTPPSRPGGTAILGCALTTPHPWATRLQDGPKPHALVAQPIWLCSYDPAPTRDPNSKTDRNRLGGTANLAVLYPTPISDPAPRRTETARFGGTANLAVLLRPSTHERPCSKTDRNHHEHRC